MRDDATPPPPTSSSSTISGARESDAAPRSLTPPTRAPQLPVRWLLSIADFEDRYEKHLIRARATARRALALFREAHTDDGELRDREATHDTGGAASPEV